MHWRREVDLATGPEKWVHTTSLVEDYLATLGDEEANEGYCAWLKDVLTRVKVREEG